MNILKTSIFTKTNFLDLVEGLGYGYSNNKFISSEHAIRQGRNQWMTAVSQIDQINITQIQVSKLMDKWGKTILYPLSKLKIFIITSPWLLAYLSKKDFKNKSIKRIINFIQDHTNSFCMIASTISSIGLFILGNHIYATGSLAYLGIGILERKGILPPKCRRVIHKIGTVFSAATGLMRGNLLSSVFAIVDLTTLIFNEYYAYKLRSTPPEQLEAIKGKKHDYIPPCPVIPADLKSKNFTLENVEVNKSHVNMDLLPPASPNTKIGDILEIFDKVIPNKNELEKLSKSKNQEDIDKFKDWEKHRNVLFKKLSKDARWKEVESLRNLTPEEFLREAISNIIKEIEKQEILIGEPISYEMLTKYTLFIAEKLPYLNHNDKIDILFRLGIEGGNYCGQGKLEVIEDITTKLLGYAQGLPLKTKVLSVLQQVRVQIWNQFYDLIWDMTPSQRLIALTVDPNDVHIRNMFLNMVGAGITLGIPHEAAKQDKSAELPPSGAYIFATMYKKIFQYVFWQDAGTLGKIYLRNNKNLANKDFWKVWNWYNLEDEPVKIQPYSKQYILESFSNAIGKQIPREEIFTWWVDWVQRQNSLDASEKENLTDEISYGNLFNEPIETDSLRGKVKEKFLIAMLLEFGVFTKTK